MSPLDELLARRVIGHLQFQAAQMLATDLRIARRFLCTRREADREWAERCRHVLAQLGDLRPVAIALTVEGKPSAEADDVTCRHALERLRHAYRRLGRSL